jgi:hypothetical protein
VICSRTPDLCILSVAAAICALAAISSTTAYAQQGRPEWASTPRAVGAFDPIDRVDLVPGHLNFSHQSTEWLVTPGSLVAVAPPVPPLWFGGLSLRAAQTSGDWRRLGMMLLHDLSQPYLEVLTQSFRELPLATGLAVGGALVLGTGAFAGWSASRRGRVSASQAFDFGLVTVGFSGDIDLRRRAFAGGLQIDLTKLFEPRPRPSTRQTLPQANPAGSLRLLGEWLAAPWSPPTDGRSG